MARPRVRRGYLVALAAAVALALVAVGAALWAKQRDDRRDRDRAALWAAVTGLPLPNDVRAAPECTPDSRCLVVPAAPSPALDLTLGLLRGIGAEPTERRCEPDAPAGLEICVAYATRGRATVAVVTTTSLERRTDSLVTLGLTDV